MNRRINTFILVILAGLLLTGIIAAQKPLAIDVQLETTIEPEATIQPEFTADPGVPLPEATLEYNAGNRYEINAYGIRFYVPMALADGTQVVEEPAVETDLSTPPAGQNPASIVFSFKSYPITATDEERSLLISGPELRVFKTDSFAQYAFDNADYGFPAQLAALQLLLDERPDLADEATLPHLPIQAGNQQFLAQPRYIDFMGGSGILYITHYSFDVSPVLDGQLIAVFQGLSDDGETYISGAFPILTGELLPDKTPADLNYDVFAAGYDAYLASLIESLNEYPAGDFIPHYEALVSLVSSISFVP